MVFSLGCRFEWIHSGWINLDIKFEYVAISPWYYHNMNINRLHLAGVVSLASLWPGPNSEVIYLNGTKWWHQRLVTSVTGQVLKHGANYWRIKNIGGDITGHNTLLVPRQNRFWPVNFWKGFCKQKSTYSSMLNMKYWHDLYINLALGYNSYNNSNSTIGQRNFTLD